MDTKQGLIYFFLAVAVVAGVSGYYLNEKSMNKAQKNAEVTDVSQQSTNTISIGFVDYDAAKQIKRIQPTIDYIAEKLGDNKTKYEGRVIVVRYLDNITDLMKEQKLDLFLDSPFPTAIAAKKSGAVPFLRRWKDGVSQYHSVFIVKNGSSINTINDFKGKTIAFEDSGSTSGYMLPKTYLMQVGFNISQSAGKNDINYIFSGDDENTIIWVIEGKADIGAISNLDFEKSTDLIKEKIKMVGRTENVPRHVLSYRSGLDPVLVEKIKQIFVNMDKDPRGMNISKDFQNTKKYDELARYEMLNTIRNLEFLER